MNYIEARCYIENDYDNTSAILVALLGEEGFESFTDEAPVLKAYCQQDLYDAARMNELCGSEIVAGLGAKIEISEVEQQNWNSTWEANYEPIDVAGKCLVRAPFHTVEGNYDYDIVITPKMSFGTGHHETTRLMLLTMLELELQGKSAVDCGCGTGVLAIMAAKQQATPVFAFDIEDWAVENSIENAQNNNVGFIEITNGGLELLAGRTFDIVIANINRNILTSGMHYFAQALPAEGILLLSGFYEADIPVITQSAEKHGLKYLSHKTENNWVACKLVKQ